MNAQSLTYKLLPSNEPNHMQATRFFMLAYTWSLQVFFMNDRYSISKYTHACTCMYVSIQFVAQSTVCSKSLHEYLSLYRMSSPDTSLLSSTSGDSIHYDFPSDDSTSTKELEFRYVK